MLVIGLLSRMLMGFPSSPGEGQRVFEVYLQFSADCDVQPNLLVLSAKGPLLQGELRSPRGVSMNSSKTFHLNVTRVRPSKALLSEEGWAAGSRQGGLLSFGEDDASGWSTHDADLHGMSTRQTSGRLWELFQRF